MELFKICPTCQTGNKPTELLCSRCFGDISGITPSALLAQQPAPVQESAFVPLHLLLPDGRRIEVRPGDILGRAGAGGELFREHAPVSRQHVRFEYNDGIWYVTDLNSTNGTWLEGIRLAPETAAKVTNSQEIRMASTFRAVLRIDVS